VRGAPIRPSDRARNHGPLGEQAELVAHECGDACGVGRLGDHRPLRGVQGERLLAHDVTAPVDGLEGEPSVGGGGRGDGHRVDAEKVEGLGEGCAGVPHTQSLGTPRRASEVLADEGDDLEAGGPQRGDVHPGPERGAPHRHPRAAHVPTGVRAR